MNGLSELSERNFYEVRRPYLRSAAGEELVYRGYHAITMHLVGFTLQEIGYQIAAGGEDLTVMAQEFLEGLAATHFPHLATHVRAHLRPEDHGDEFGFVLDLILDGLERANSQPA